MLPNHHQSHTSRTFKINAKMETESLSTSESRCTWYKQMPRYAQTAKRLGIPKEGSSDCTSPLLSILGKLLLSHSTSFTTFLSPICFNHAYMFFASFTLVIESFFLSFRSTYDRTWCWSTPLLVLFWPWFWFGACGWPISIHIYRR